MWRYGEHGSNVFFIIDNARDLQKVCGISPSMFEGNIEKAREMTIKICLLLNDDNDKSKN
jgi:hypothetical protein